MSARTFSVCAASAVLLVAAVWGTVRRNGPPPSHWPDAAHLDSLSQYLVRGEAAPSPDDYVAFLPARRPASGGRPRSTAPAFSARVSAILIAGDRRLAIIDDRNVRPGDRLAGGALVLSIGPDHVVVRDRDGSRRTLRLSTATEQSQ